MKFLAVIFSLFILMLSVWPCTDHHECEEPAGQEVAEHVQDADHASDHEGHADHCTPFCTCQCCGSHYTAQVFSPGLGAVFSYAPPRSDRYTFYIPVGFNDSVWHPPIGA